MDDEGMMQPGSSAEGAAPDDAASRLERVVAALVRAGCVAAHEEETELLDAAAERGIDVDELIDRRTTGEPIAWITGRTRFCGLTIRVAPGVYVPRWQTQPLAERAANALPETGIAIDLCTGTGAIAAVLASRKPRATVVATDIDSVAVACARANGVNALVGDLDAPVSVDLRGRVDVVTAVVPYVPTEELHLLPRDTLAFEPRVAIEGGPGGLGVLARAIDRSAGWLRAGGGLFLEVGGRPADPAAAVMDRAGYLVTDVLADEDGDDRAIVGRRR
jgi:release factor glutamine methyltransferase